MRSLRSTSLLLLLALSTLPALSQTVSPAPPLMNFQGRLSKPDGTPLPDGTYALTFSLWDAASAGSKKWEKSIHPTTVRNGVFGVLLDNLTDSLFQSDLWLEIRVGTDAPLAPRQRLVSVAYAFKANSVPDGSIGGRQIANGSLTADKFANNLLNPLAWLLNGNSGINPTTQFLGTTDSQPLVFRTNNAERMRLGSDGNVGIGTTTPEQALSLAKGLNLDQSSANNGSLTAQGTQPALRFGSRSGEGIASKRTSGGNQYGLDFYTASQQRMSITVDGKVGIGTITPTNPFSVVGNADFFGKVGIGTTAPINPLSVLGNADFSGKVGIGTTNPLTQLHVNGSLHLAGTGEDISVPAGQGLTIGHRDPATNMFTSRLVVDTAGRMGIGTSTPDHTLSINGDMSLSSSLQINNTGNASAIDAINHTIAPTISATNSSNGLAGFFASGDQTAIEAFNASSLDTIYISNGGKGRAAYFEGNIYVSGKGEATGGFWLSSDARFKTNIAPLPDALDTILALRGVSYDWRRDEWKERRFPEGRQVGFIAQEVERVLPELVSTDRSGYKSVAYQNVVPVLVEAMKAQQKQIDRLRNENRKLKTLEARLSALAEEIATIRARTAGK